MKYKAMIGLVIIITLLTVFHLGKNYYFQMTFKNTHWVLIEGKQINIESTNVEITLNFEASNRISGYSGVNQFGGVYHIKNSELIENKGLIEIGEMYSTLMASGDPLLNNNEGQFYQLLALAKSYRMNLDYLILLDENGNELLILERIMSK